MMRDYYCDDVVLSKTLDHCKHRIEKMNNDINLVEEDIKNGIQRHSRNNYDYIRLTKIVVFSEHITWLKAMYSLGMDCAEMEEPYLQSLNVICSLDYFLSLQVFCMGTLLEVPPEKLKVIVNLMDEAKTDDILLDFMVNAYGLKRNMMSKKLVKKRPYRELVELIELAATDKEKASDKLYEFVEKKWLNGLSLTDAHKETGYVGQWCYEAGVIAKMFSLDDSKLKDSNHYPYDLVHYKNGAKYIITPIHYEENTEEEKLDSSKAGIPTNSELEQIIPAKFHELVNQAIADYRELSDEEYWKKYELLQEIWLEAEDYQKEKEKRNGILGMVLVCFLTRAGYILQLDWKENTEENTEDAENYWGKEKTKLVHFKMDSDQAYYARVPVTSTIKTLYEVEIGNGMEE